MFTERLRIRKYLDVEAEPNLTGTIQELGEFGYIVCRFFTIFVSLLVISITLCFSSTVG